MLSQFVAIMRSKVLMPWFYPGGESTTIAQLAEVFGIFELIKNKIQNGLPVYGSCAGMILLADQILDAKEGQKSFGGLDITVRRNAFGRQVDSFESDIAFDDGSAETDSSGVYSSALG
jgi:pyridoxal 5'-phosphate synthase pdxT subunit